MEDRCGPLEHDPRVVMDLEGNVRERGSSFKALRNGLDSRRNAQPATHLLRRLRADQSYFLSLGCGGAAGASLSTSWNSKCDFPCAIWFSPLELNVGSSAGNSRGSLVV